MTLIVETGTGLTDAESYISVADADAYVTKWHDDADWNTASTERKERALRRGTRFVDDHAFFGWRANEDQKLDWPRAWIGWVNGQLIDTETVPAAIKEATVEAALRDVRGEALFPDHDGGTIRRLSQQVGNLSQTTEYASAQQAGKTFEAIRAILKPFLTTGKNGGFVRGL